MAGVVAAAADIVAGFGESRLLVTGNEILWMLIEFMLPLWLDNLTGGTGGPEERTEEAVPEVTGSAPGSTSTINQTTTVGVTGSVVEVILRRIEHDVVNDPTTGASNFERTDDRTVTGTIDVCRDPSGGANATVSTTIAIDATTHPDVRGRVGVHSVGTAHTESKFQGQVSTKQVTVAISGSELFDGDIDTKLTYSPVLLTKQPDGSFSGGGSSDAKGTFPGCSGIALSETGTIGLTATQATKADGTPGDWSIVSAMVPTNSNVVVSCSGESLPGVATFFGGVGYNFIHDLGTITVPAEGGTVQLHKDGSGHRSEARLSAPAAELS